MSGDLTHRVQFERRSDAPADDPDGQATAGWSNLFGPRWARLEGKTGSETFAGRIEGKAIYELKVRLDPETREITSNDRVRDLNPDTWALPGGIFGIRSVLPFPPDPQNFLLMTLEAGGANG